MRLYAEGQGKEALWQAVEAQYPFKDGRMKYLAAVSSGNELAPEVPVEGRLVGVWYEYDHERWSADGA